MINTEVKINGIIISTINIFRKVGIPDKNGRITKAKYNYEIYIPGGDGVSGMIHTGEVSHIMNEGAIVLVSKVFRDLAKQMVKF